MLLIFQNATVRVYGAWIRTYYVLCSKTFGTFGGLLWCPDDSRQAARNARICEARLLGAMPHTPLQPPGALLLTWINLNSSKDLSNHLYTKARGEITYPVPKFSGCAVEFWEWINNSPTLYNGLDYLSMAGLKLKHELRNGWISRVIYKTMNAVAFKMLNVENNYVNMEASKIIFSRK